jgi:tRNA threonylcarbamoyladenosine biosynthesis protein TsaB
MSPDSASRDPSRRRCVLALGTSTEWCTVALRYRDRAGRPRTDALGERAGNEHSVRVLAMADALLSAAGRSVSEVDAIAFDAGPGSFTGLRIGCGVAQGLGFALERPLVPVASLEALGYLAIGPDKVDALAMPGPFETPVPGQGAELALVAVDARMGEVYCAAYRMDGGEVVALGPIRAMAPQEALGAMLREAGERWDGGGVDSAAAAPSVIAVGNAYARYEALSDAARERGIAMRGDAYPRGDAIAAIGWHRLAAGGSVRASAAAPIYVRDKVALDVDEQLRLRVSREAARPLAEGAAAGR